MKYEGYTYPPCDAPLADAYGCAFESVYVMLHPFVSVPEDLAWKATKHYPTDEQIAAHGAKCGWAGVAARTELNSCSRLSQALLTSIGSLGAELCDYPARDALQAFLQSGSTWMPTEGRFEPLLQTDFLNAFEVAGQQELIFVPEFPAVDPIQRLDKAKLASRQDSFPARGSLVAPDASFLFTVDWDSFFTLFYGPRAFVTEVVRRQNLEGFFATPTTEHLWFNYALGCAVVTISPDVWSAV